MPNLKNFTTSISAGKTIGEIDELLIEFGAENIMKVIEDKSVKAIMFTLDLQSNQIPFRIEANVEKTAEFLANEYNKSHSRKSKSKDDFINEAYNITWRIWKDWIHSQISIIATENVDAIKLLLGFVAVNKDLTLGDKFLEGEYRKMLPAFKS